MLRKYSGALFGEGVTGAYHFPWAAPLAALSRPLDSVELKHCARTLREAAGDGKINAVEACFTAFPPESGAALFGPRLEIAVPKDIGGEKAVGLFSPTVIGACLFDSAGNAAVAAGAGAASLPAPPKLSFRAAAVANMFWRPLKTDGTASGYKWKIGPLCWLPPVRKTDDPH